MVETQSKKDEEVPRETWGHWFEFLLSSLGYCIGLGNVWRFPFKAYNNGGGAFLIPYGLMLILAGIPLFYLEMSMGQFSSSGPISQWNAVPMFRGIGYAMCVVSAFVSIYYNVIIAWVFYYMFVSFASELPWEKCDNNWNTMRCDDLQQDCRRIGGYMDNYTCKYIGYSEEQIKAVKLTDVKWRSASEEYFKFNVLKQSSGLDEMGELLWPQAMCLLLSWVLMFVCLCKGIQSSGKVVYVTVTLPFIILFIFLIRGVTLEGHLKGVKFFITPQWDKLLDSKPWLDAATQIFYSIGIGFGGLGTMASYNKFHNNVYRDALMVSIMNCCASVFAGFVIFSIIGYMAHELGVEVEDVVAEGTGLAFIAYPKAATLMPISPLWSVLFFIMLLTLGLDTQFCMFETVITAIIDEWPQLRKRKIWVMAVLAIIMFLFGLPMCTEGGIYLFTMYDWYSAGLSIMTIGIVECVVITWMYGWRNLSYDIKSMLGFRPGIWWYLCWWFISPAVLVFIAVFSLIQYIPAYYDDYTFPSWAEGVGWMMTFSSLIFIPILAVWEFYKAEGSFMKRMRSITRPNRAWGPRLPDDREHWLSTTRNPHVKMEMDEQQLNNSP